MQAEKEKSETNVSKPKKRGSKKVKDVTAEDSQKTKKSTGDGNDDLEPDDNKSSNKLMLIRGSCHQYFSRMDISKLVRRKNVPLPQATKM